MEGLLQAMAEKGYEKATISAIAKAAGLTSGLVHYHFSSKQAILLELVELLATRLETRFQELAQGSSPAAELEAFIDSRLATGATADPEAVACWVAIGTEALRQPEVGEVYRRFMARQQQQLAQLVSQLCRPEQDAASIASAILAAIEGCYQLAAAAPELTPEGFAARSVRAMTVGLLVGETNLSEPS